MIAPSYHFEKEEIGGFFVFDQETIDIIKNRIGYEFKNKELLEQAFTRRSYSMENGGENNEILEFIGDAALNLVAVKILRKEFGYFNERKQQNPNYYYLWETYETTFSSDKDEGQLTEIKKRIVRKSTLADAIDDLGLQNYLIMGKGDRKRHVEQSNSTKEDLFEAIIGAIALDTSWDINTIQEVVENIIDINDIIGSDEDSYIEEIQKWSLKHHDVLPEYSVCSYLPREMNIGTPEWAKPNTIWSVINKPSKQGKFASDTKYASLLTLNGVSNGVSCYFIGYGHSKNQAKEEASRLAYEHLDEHGLLWTIQDEIEKPCKRLAINQLETLARRGYFSLPTYDFYEDYDEDGNPVWKCKCHIEIEEEHIYFCATSSSKKDAKKDAAWRMLKHVLDMEEN